MAGPTYPHAVWCDEFTAKMALQRIKIEEVGAYFTAQLYEHCVKTLLPEWRDKLLQSDGAPLVVANHQLMISVLVRMAQGMGKELGNFLEAIETEKKQMSLEQSSICLKTMGRGTDGSIVACSLPAKHQGHCA